MCARDKEKELSQLSSTQPSAPLISSVNAVEITAGEVKHVSQWGIKRVNGQSRKERERGKKIWGHIHVHNSNNLLIRGFVPERVVSGRNWWEGRRRRKIVVQFDDKHKHCFFSSFYSCLCIFPHTSSVSSYFSLFCLQLCHLLIRDRKKKREREADTKIT